MNLSQDLNEFFQLLVQLILDAFGVPALEGAEDLEGGHDAQFLQRFSAFLQVGNVGVAVVEVQSQVALFHDEEHAFKDAENEFK